MRLVGVEAAEVAASASAATPARPAEAAASAKKAASSSAEVTAALPARQNSLCAQRLHCIADAVHVHAGQRTYRACLAADGHGFVSKVGVAGNRGKRRAG